MKRLNGYAPSFVGFGVFGISLADFQGVFDWLGELAKFVDAVMPLLQATLVIATIVYTVIKIIKEKQTKGEKK